MPSGNSQASSGIHASVPERPAIDRTLGEDRPFGGTDVWGVGEIRPRPGPIGQKLLPVGG